MPPTPDALPRALWDAGVRPDGVFLEHGHHWIAIGCHWRPHLDMQHAWGVLAWVRAHEWCTYTMWAPGKRGAIILLRYDKDELIEERENWTDATEAAECEAICRAVLRAVQGMSTQA